MFAHEVPTKFLPVSSSSAETIVSRSLKIKDINSF